MQLKFQKFIEDDIQTQRIGRLELMGNIWHSIHPLYSGETSKQTKHYLAKH